MNDDEVFAKIKNRELEQRRLRSYELADSNNIDTEKPLIIRLVTKGTIHNMDHFIQSIVAASIRLCEEVSNVKYAYMTTDEIILVLVKNKRTTQQWYNGDVQDIVSMASSIATYRFNQEMEKIRMISMIDLKPSPFHFKAKAFQLPEHEIANYLSWRQERGERNVVNLASQVVFNNKELYKKTKDEKIKDLKEKNASVNMSKYRMGFIVQKEFYILDESQDVSIAPNNIRRSRWDVDENVPVIKNNHGFIEHLITSPDHRK